MEFKETLSFFADLPGCIKNVKIEILVSDVIEARDTIHFLQERGYNPRGAFCKSTSSYKVPILKKK